MYCPGTIVYLDEPLCLGKYLGSAIDVGPAVTAKVLQHDGKVVYRSIDCPLSIEECANKIVQQDMVTFSENAEECLEFKLTCTKVVEVGISDTLGYIPYADKDQNEMNLSDMDEEGTPEVGDEYLHVSVTLLCGSQMIHGTINTHKQDLDGNPICCWLDIWILDTHLYDIGILDGEVTLLTTNMIAQAMYAQYDVDRNKYLLLECFVDIQKDPWLLAWMTRRLSIMARITCFVIPYVGMYVASGRMVPHNGRSCQTKNHILYRLLSML